MTLGEKIKALRKSIGLTQTELGQKVGVQKNAVSKWECGRVEDIPTATIKALANLFGVSASYLIDDEVTFANSSMYPSPPVKMSTIGSRIRARREELDLSQEELGTKLGYKSRSSINKIELGERNLTQARIKVIADALETTPGYIMGWEELPIKQQEKTTQQGTCEKIRTLRKEQGQTLEEIANKVGVGKSTVRKWETGQIANMRKDKIASLAEALHTTPAYLMGWEEEQPIGEKTSCLRDRLYEAMVKEGKKATDLTKDLGIPKSAISQYLSGKSQNMDSGRLYTIAKYLHVSEAWLQGYNVPAVPEMLPEKTQREIKQQLIELVKILPEDMVVPLYMIVKALVPPGRSEKT